MLHLPSWLLYELIETKRHMHLRPTILSCVKTLCIMIFIYTMQLCLKNLCISTDAVGKRAHFQSILRASPLTRKYIKLPVWSSVASSNVAVKNAFCHSSPVHYVVTRQSCYIMWWSWYQITCERFDLLPFLYEYPELWVAGLWRVFFSL